jgi:molecular chaperone DnaK
MSDDAKKRKIAGIDLGTTYSAIAHFDEYGKVDVIPNSDNERITPSVILFEDEEVIVGKIAKNQAVSNPENVVQFVKRHMGEPDWVRVINGREYTPEILSAIILKRIVSDAEDQIGEPISDVVITCPAYFNDNERKATMDAGKIAGLSVVGIINEPTAAAIAYGMNNLDRDVKALVYDLGGGTFDVTVLHIDGNNVKVLATDGERRLGGKDWDDMLLNHVAEKFIDEHKVDPREDPEAYQDLVIKVEEAKKTLSKKPVSKIFAQCAGKSLKMQVTREEFEELTRPLLEQTETYLEVVLKKADLTWEQIDVVIPVGGMTRIPAVQLMLERVTKKKLEKGVNPDECVAVGAAYWAAILMVREANSLAEKVQQGVATAEEKEQQQEAAAAVEEAVPEEIVGMLGGVVVQNVNSHSLGIVTIDKQGQKKNMIMIHEQTPLPATVTKVFGTFMDNQVTVEVKILEGESEDPEECSEIGTCVISDLPPNRPKGSKVSVTYHYSEDGRIHVTAKDHQTSQMVKTEIKREAQGLTEEEMAQKGEEIARLLEREAEEAAAAGGGYAEGGEQEQGYAEGAAETGYAEAGYAEGGEAGYAEGAPEGGYAEGTEGEAGYAEGEAGYAPEAEGEAGYADNAGYAAEGEGEGGYAEGEGFADSADTHR